MLKYPSSLKKSGDRDAPRNPKGLRYSIPSGDMVLCNLPPYATQPWLSMGIVVHYAMLAEAGIRARVIRALDRPDATPKGVEDASLFTFLRDPSMDERMAAMDREYRATPAYFDGLVNDLLAGGERVVALCLFRNSVDVGLWVGKLLKQKRSDIFLILGGPEAVEDPESLRVPWADAVVGARSEAVFVPLAKAALAGRPEEAARLANVWLNPRLGAPVVPEAERFQPETPPFPTIDYAPLVPLLVDDPEPTMPLLLNWGCPYNCGFCANRNIYGRFTPGSVTRVLDEMDAITDVWRSLHGSWTPGLTLQLSDATTNVLPAQFDELLQGVIDRRRSAGWGAPVRGQMLFDQRLTDKTAALMREARFEGAFFGLDAASDTFRRAIKKPGTIAQVVGAMERFHHARSSGGLFFGIPVGIPGETEAYFRETERFVDWAVTLKGTVRAITVLPYVFALSSQDQAFNQQNIGERRGVLWRTAGPAGDPEERGRRFMRLFDHIDGRVEASSPIAPYVALPAMLPPSARPEFDAWMLRHGRSFNALREVTQTATGESVPLREVVEARLDPKLEAMRAQAETAFTQPPPNEWLLAETDWMPDKAGGYRGVIAVFRKDGGVPPVAVLLEPLDETRPAFVRSQAFNLSYLSRWGDVDCGFDATILAYCAGALDRATV